MDIMSFALGTLGANCYVVSGGGRECLLIDVGGDPYSVLRIIKQKNLTPKAVLLTHGHYDHIGGVKYFHDMKIPVYIHEADAVMLRTDKSLSKALGEKQEYFDADILLRGGEILNIAGLKIEVLHTPGHTKGGVCYKIGGSIFTGDTLFCGAIGRTDFEGGDFNELISSIRENLLSLKGDYDIYPGHDESTTLNEERSSNYFLAGEDSI